MLLVCFLSICLEGREEAAGQRKRGVPLGGLFICPGQSVSKEEEEWRGMRGRLCSAGSGRCAVCLPRVLAEREPFSVWRCYRLFSGKKTRGCLYTSQSRGAVSYAGRVTQIAVCRGGEEERGEEEGGSGCPSGQPSGECGKETLMSRQVLVDGKALLLVFPGDGGKKKKEGGRGRG